MYWPIGAANVYALSKSGVPKSILVQSEDGLNNGPALVSPQTRTDKPKGEVLAGGKTDESGTNSEIAKGAADAGHDDGEILDVKVSRSGSVFITLTRSTLTVWQTKPAVALAGVARSPRSIKAYGFSTALHLRPDALIIVVQTSLGFLINYSLAVDPSAKVYHVHIPEPHKHARRPSVDGYNQLRKSSVVAAGLAAGEGEGFREINVRFRMVIRIDAGISSAIALEEELVVATRKPSAVQCIRWVAEQGNPQTSTELVSRMAWIGKKSNIGEMVYDKPMNLATWIGSDGRVYAVQRRSSANTKPEDPKELFQGFCFREPQSAGDAAVKVAINARFSLIAIGCMDGHIDVYAVKDYMGNIPLSHSVKLPMTSTSHGDFTCLSYSPDGYCLFAGYEKGWATWSVYGKPGANSFGADRVLSRTNDEPWLSGIKVAFWLGAGCELALLPMSDDRLWMVEMARNAIAGCFSPANISQGLLHSSTSVMMYRGHDVTDITSLPSEMSLWHATRVPSSYLVHQWPIKAATISSDGKYVAVAGRRGLAHYSVASAKWKTFDDLQSENEFAVRGGMCWHHHILIAAVETSGRYQIRLYSRDKTLHYSHIQHIEPITAPAITTTVTGVDSLLVYTHENTLLHFVIIMTSSTPKIVQVGQIGFHGIIRAPTRVRAISWVLPEDQLEHGDPSQDVATATVLFLVDGKLVLLQPSTNEQGELKYDMRVIAQNVEFYMLLRDQPDIVATLEAKRSETQAASGLSLDGHLGHSLRDSLWYFDGQSFHTWSDIQDVMACAPAELARDLPSTVAVPLDFYPLSVIVTKGIISGIDAEIVQRRDTDFGFFRHAPRNQLFLPQLLRDHLKEYNSPAALHLSTSYQLLPYFPHALEILLHDVLDLEVDNPPSPPETALLPTVLSFLSSFSSYLDVVVNCTRKTELRSWRTLFSHLPPVSKLFEQSLSNGKLNTAAGYLLVLHAFEQDSFQVREFGHLLRLAVAQQDWELCKELARFLVGIDASGETLSAALAEAGLRNARNGSNESSSHEAIGQGERKYELTERGGESSGQSRSSQVNGTVSQSGAVLDYFSARQHNQRPHS